MRKWLLLTYKIPREPTSSRVYIWRNLKKLAAVAIQDAIWILPKTAKTQEHLQRLATEITELGGEAILWETQQLYTTERVDLEKLFTEPLIAEYKSIGAELKKKNCDYVELSKRLREAQKRDYYSLELGKRIREKLLKQSGG